MCARHPVSLPYTNADHSPSCPTHPESSILIGSRLEGFLTAESHGCSCPSQESTNPCRCQVITIDFLPDEILLVIFDYFVDEDAFGKKDVEAWQSLVHVCRRWRSVTFGSPRRLNLRLFCGPKTPVGDALDIWPPLPLVVRGGAYDPKGVNNIIAGLQLSDRVCQINLWGRGTSPMKKVLATMQQSFPELTDMEVKMPFATVKAPPDSFLGGSTPRLRKLHLHGISFPDLPILLFSATHLVDLQLCNIPLSGYISPEAMATALSSLPCLKILSLHFLSSQSHTEWETRRLPSTVLTRSLLPVLDKLRFEGDTKYLDDLVARIDAPHLNNLDVTFFYQNEFDIPQFIQFTSRTPTLETLEKAYVIFEFDGAAVKLSSQKPGYGELKVEVLCRGFTWRVSFLKRFCTSYLPLSTSEDLHIYGDVDPRPWDDIENIQWLEVLHPFSAAKNLYLSEYTAPHFGRALHLVGGSTAEVLPVVQNIFLVGFQPKGPVPEGIEEFIATRQLSGRLITVSTIPSEKEI